jgi:hypothetical protein
MKVYLLDERNIFIGTEYVNPMGALPRCATKPPPETTGDEVACFIGNNWVVLPSYPTPSPTTEPIPQSITPRQIRLQLSAIGMRQVVEDYVATASLEIKDWWEFSLAYERSAPLLVEAATTLGMTSEQLDQFFIEANKL